MVDGQVYGPYELASDPIFSRDGQHVVWSATDTGSKREQMFVDGIARSAGHDVIYGFHASRDAEHLVFIAQRGDDVLVVFNKEESPPYMEVKDLSINPSGHHVAYRGEVDDGWLVVHDDQLYGPFPQVSGPAMSPDGSRLAFGKKLESGKWPARPERCSMIYDIRYSVRAAARLLLAPGRGEMCGGRQWW